MEYHRRSDSVKCYQLPHNLPPPLLVQTLLEIEPPAENKPICALEKSNFAKSSTTNVLSPNSTRLPTERLLAKA